jgi:hypothetical protein
MTNLQTAVEATDECRRAFEEWYVKDYGEKEYYKSNTKAQVWVAFQAAWNRLRADLTPAVGYSREQMVEAMQWADVTDHYIKEDRDEYLSDLTPAAEVPIPTVKEMADAIEDAIEMDWYGSLNTSLRTDIEDYCKTIHQLLTKGRGGV